MGARDGSATLQWGVNRFGEHLDRKKAEADAEEEQKQGRIQQMMDSGFSALQHMMTTNADQQKLERQFQMALERDREKEKQASADKFHQRAAELTRVQLEASSRERAASAKNAEEADWHRQQIALGRDKLALERRRAEAEAQRRSQADSAASHAAQQRTAISDQIRKAITSRSELIARYGAQSDEVAQLDTFIQQKQAELSDLQATGPRIDKQPAVSDPGAEADFTNP